MIKYNISEEKFNLIERLIIDNDYKNNILVCYDKSSKLLKNILESIKKIYCIDNIEKPCNKCQQCALIEKFLHPNIKIIIPNVNEGTTIDNKLILLFYNYLNSNETYNLGTWSETIKSENKQLIITKESITNIIDFMNKEYLDNKPKICILWGPEFLNISSANTLLKTLEEPKEKCIFILLTEDISNVLETIKSRAINIFFYDNDGNTNNIKNIKEANIFINILRTIYSSDYAKIQDVINEIDKYTRVDVINILYTGIELLNLILMLKFKLKISNNYDESINAAIIKISNILEIENIKFIEKELENLIFFIKRNANIKMCISRFILEIKKKIY